MSEPAWCPIRQHYCRCHDFGKRCDDADDSLEQPHAGRIVETRTTYSLDDDEQDDWVNPGGTSDDWE